MTSKSRVAQEKLAALEKDSAPFEDQLLEAAKFIGIDLDEVGRLPTEKLDCGEQFEVATYHGREEWLLRWLLKKLQAPKDTAPRQTPKSWTLLCHLIRTIPLPNAARLLSERKFTAILRQTLEDAQKLVNTGLDVEVEARLVLGKEEKSVKTSRKRNRSGDLIQPISDFSNHGTHSLPHTIFSAMYHMLRLTIVDSNTSDGGRTAAFSAEHMKSVIRTTAEDAAKILGSWLRLCQKAAHNAQNADVMKPWLSPFIEIWEARIIGTEDLAQFSLYCSQPLLCLMKAVNAGEAPVDWKDKLEQLAARNIMTPARADKSENQESELLNTLSKVSVIQDSTNAPILFEVAIRSVQAQGLQKRRANDLWFQHVFATFKAAMPSTRAEQNGKAIQQMLYSAIIYKVDLGLAILRTVTSEHCLAKEATDWLILGTVIKLDVNALLIPEAESHLLETVLSRITAVSLDPAWADLSVQVVSGVLVPLMNGFAKVRDLTAFVHHWHAQLVEFEKLRKESGLFSMPLFSAWEDERLQTEFSKIMEASLTVPQITQLLDWLTAQVEESPDAVSVLLDTIAGSVNQEDVADTVELRLYEIMFDNLVSEKLDERYKWRSLRVISRTLKWLDVPALEVLAGHWENATSPLNSLSHRFSKASLLNTSNGNSMELEMLEAVRLTCALWGVSTRNDRLAGLCRTPVLAVLNSLAQDLSLLPSDMRDDKDLGRELCGSTPNGLFRGIGWMLWSCIHCVVVENRNILQIGLHVENDACKDLLQSVFWVACVTPDEPGFEQLNSWLHNNSDAFPSIWKSIISNDEVMDHKALRPLILDIMTSSETNKDNPLVKSSTINRFAIQCLDSLRQDIFSRKDREIMLKAWSGVGRSTSTAMDGNPTSLNPAVLSLQAKMMQRAAVYEGMKYQDLADIAGGLTSTELQNLDQSLVSFKELGRRTMAHVTANLDQTRNREYASDALKHLRKKTKIKSDSKRPHKLGSALIALFDILVEAFREKRAQLKDLDIASESDCSSTEQSFKHSLLSQLQDLLSNTKKSSKADKEAEKSLTIIATIDALTKFEPSGAEWTSTVAAAKTCIASHDISDANIAKHLKVFISTQNCLESSSTTEFGFFEDTSTIHGRQAIKESVHALVKGKGNSQKLSLLKVALADGASILSRLGGILTVRHLIVTCEDSRSAPDEEDEDDAFDLSAVYSALCDHLWKSATIREFSLLSETMTLMLRTKHRAMTQWNIDSTLGSITIMCSRNAPHLRPTRAGIVFQHLCQLLNTLLTSHRLKLQGHFHLVVQAMQALLRCFFTPLPHSTSKISKLFAPPSWLSSPKHQLKASHAVAFTRLVTLICDPSVSSVTRSKDNNLTSATEKAKRMAGQHMKFLLMLYVQLQLEMKMLPEIREKMIPGLYAIFDTTTPDMRRSIGDGLDSSGRSVFGTLFRDYQRFGKWKGS